MRLKNSGSGRHWLLCLMLALLMPSITSCASVEGASSWTPCQHPPIDPSTQHGVYRSLLAYQKEVDRCNAVNGL